MIRFRPDDPNAPAGGDDPSADRPDYLESQFASAEEQARAYAEARTEMKRAQSQLALERGQFTQALTSLEHQPAPAAQPWNPSADPTISAYARAAEDGDYATMLAIQMQVSQASTQQIIRDELEKFGPTVQQGTQADREIALRLAEQQVAPLFGDRWPEIASKVGEHLTENGHLLGPPSVEEYARTITSLAKTVDYDRLAADQRAAEAERAAKIAAQTLDNGTGRVATDTDEKKAEWDRVRSAQTGGYSRLVGQ